MLRSVKGICRDPSRLFRAPANSCRPCIRAECLRSVPLRALLLLRDYVKADAPAGRRPACLGCLQGRSNILSSTVFTYNLLLTHSAAAKAGRTGP